MPKGRVTSPVITKMGEEVFELFACQTKFSEKAFHSAFANVAHKHEIYHHKDAAEYNRFFGWVMEEVKLVIKKHNESQPPPQEAQREIRVSQLDPGKLRFSRDLNF